MDVILDANTYISLLHAQGPDFTASNRFVELITYLRRTKSDLVIPEPVLAEVVKKYEDLLGQSVKDARDAHDTLVRNLFSTWDTFDEPNIEAEIKTFTENLLQPSAGFEAKIFDAYDSVPLREVVHRGVHRIRPANDNGEELRDVVIWFLALEYVKRSGRKTAFVTADNHFKQGQTELHPNLVDDVNRAKVDIVYYQSISQFVAHNSLDSEPISMDEVNGFVDQNEMARLIIGALLGNKLAGGTVDNAILYPRTFVSGQKYKVADDSFYVEASYMAEAHVLIEQTLFTNSLYATAIPVETANAGVWGQPFTQPFELTPNALPSGGLFAKIGQPISGFTLPSAIQTKPTTVYIAYQYPLEIDISFRILGGKSESLELSQISLGEPKRIDDSEFQKEQDAAK